MQHDSSSLAARAEIADVIATYCHAIDRRRWELMEQLFHDDATYSFGTIEGTWREFVAIAKALIDPLPATHHQLGQTAFEIDGDRATTETYMTATHRIPADAPVDGPFPGRGHDYQLVMAGRYVDRFERRGGQWRIAHRVGVTDWTSEHAFPDGTEFPEPLRPDPGAAMSFTVPGRVSP